MNPNTTTEYMLDEEDNFRGYLGHEDDSMARPRCRCLDGATTTPPYETPVGLIHIYIMHN